MLPSKALHFYGNNENLWKSFYSALSVNLVDISCQIRVSISITCWNRWSEITDSNSNNIVLYFTRNSSEIFLLKIYWYNIFIKYNKYEFIIILKTIYLYGKISLEDSSYTMCIIYGTSIMSLLQLPFQLKNCNVVSIQMNTSCISHDKVFLLHHLMLNDLIWQTNMDY